MSETELNRFTFPDEFEEPFFSTFKIGEDQKDSSHFATAENGNLVFSGGGTFTWDAGTNTLSWTDEIKITGHTTGPFFAVISAGSIELQEGEVLFFTMPRQLRQDQSVSLKRSTRVFRAGVRLHDLRLFAVRIGTKVLFGNGASILSGQSGTVFGSGLGGGAGISQVDAGDGIVVTNPTGPTATVGADFAGTGGNLGSATTVARSDHSHALVGHTHETELKLEPTAGTTVLNLDADGQITGDTLADAKLYRNGQRLAQNEDYTLDLGAKTATLTFSTVAGDRFVIDRRTT